MNVYTLARYVTRRTQLLGACSADERFTSLRRTPRTRTMIITEGEKIVFPLRRPGACVIVGARDNYWMTYDNPRRPEMNENIRHFYRR